MWYWHHTAVEKQLKWAHCWEYLGQELLSCGLLRAFWLENSAQPGFDLKTSGAQWSGILANSLTHDLLANPPLAVAHITTSQIVFGRLEWAPKSQMTDSKNCAANVIWTPRHPCHSRLYWHSATVTPSYKTHKTHHLNLFDLSSQLLHFLHVDVSLGVFLGASLRSRSHIIHDSLSPCHARFKVTHQLLLDVLQLGVSHLKYISKENCSSWESYYYLEKFLD